MRRLYRAWVRYGRGCIGSWECRCPSCAAVRRHERERVLFVASEVLKRYKGGTTASRAVRTVMERVQEPE